MPKPICLALFLFLIIFCNAQGSWNIGYIKVDSIKQEHVGQLVRIDFKSNNPWTNSDGQRGIRSYVGTNDTGVVTIDTTSFVLVERRKIYVDHGSYGDQYLECINCKQQVLLINDAKILGVDGKSILFQFDIKTNDNSQLKGKQIKIVSIDRIKLDGVMYRR